MPTLSDRPLTVLLGCALLFAACGGGTSDACDDCDDPACSAAASCQPTCGDGELEAGEVCDDGNTTDGDGCAADCARLEFCGDGVLDRGEACDDGNTVSGDGCRADCAKAEACGDGALDLGETCDDGNATNSDGCSSACTVDPGSTCTGTPSVCNEAPVAVDDAASADEDAVVTLSVATLLANDTDRETDALSLVMVQNGVNGVASFTPGDAEVVLALDENFAGTASFEYVVSDGIATDVGLVTVTVHPVDDPPVAATDAVTVDEDTAASISVATLLANDTLVENGPLALVSVQGAVNGEVSFAAGDADVVFVPDADFFGAASFEYVVSDGVTTAVGLVNVTVAGVNDAPVNAVPAADQVTSVQVAKVFSSASTSTISIADIDAGTAPVRVRLAVTDGTVTLGATTGLTFTAGDGTADATTTFTGTLADINAALDGTSVTPAVDFTGAMELTVTTNDLGNTGSGGARADVDVVSITVRAGTLAQISAGFGHTCGRSSEGLAFCWGDDSSGELGNGAGSHGQAPTPVVGVGGTGLLQNVTQISVGSNHTCAVTSGGEAFCWGSDGSGQLGNGAGGSSHTPTRVVGPGGTGVLQHVVQISAGNFFSCAVTSDGDAFCWGSGALGSAGGTSQTPTPVVGVGGAGVLAEVTQITAGTFHACAVTSAGGAFCWGNDGTGQLGNGAGAASDTPIQVVGEGGTGVLENVRQIDAYDHTCAVTGDGSAFCWGFGGLDQLGNGSTADRDTPTRVRGNGGIGFLSNVTQIDAGHFHTCARASVGSSTGVAFCWGGDDYGGLGTSGSFGNSPIYPARVTDPGGVWPLENVSQISAGFGHTCGLTGSGEAYCWGWDEFGTLGDGGTSVNQENAIPVLTPNVSVATVLFTRISAGGQHSCGVVDGGAAYCWGSDGSGRLGNGAGASTSQVPVPVVGTGGAGFLADVTQVDAADSHTCAVTSAGDAYCWGDDAFGQVGNGAASSSQTPVQVLGVGGTGVLADVAGIDAGLFHTCAATRDGSAFCWGVDSAGQLGNGAGGASETPTQVVGVGGAGVLANVTQIGVGDSHSCAVTSDGSVFCWGSDGSGQLGNGAGGSSQTPIRVVGVGGTGFLEHVSRIAVGPGYSCAGTGSGSVYCWGSDAAGQLGNGGASANSQTPVQVIGGAQGGATLANVTQLSGRRNHACATTSGGNVFCWGSDTDGQLGNGGASASTQDPVLVLGVDAAGVLSAVTQISAGDNHSCAVSSAGSAFCWGRDANGQLGDGGVSTSTQAPTEVSAPVGVGM